MRRKYEQFLKSMCTAVLAAGVLLAVEKMPGEAQEFTLNQKQDIYLLFQTINAKELDFKTNSGIVPLAMPTTHLGGLGFGYHFTPHVAGRFEMTFGDTKLSGKGPAKGTSRDVLMNSGIFNVDWFLMDKRVAPYVTAGLGWQYIESQISNTPVPTAYWDPWWGYTVTSSYPTYSETDFLLTAGIGIRWDVTDHFFLKVSADASRINYVNINGNTNQVKYGLIAGAAY